MKLMDSFWEAITNMCVADGDKVQRGQLWQKNLNQP